MFKNQNQDTDIDILIQANEELLSTIATYKKTERKNLEYLVALGSVSFGVVMSFFLVLYSINRDADIRQYKQEIQSLRESKLAKENRELKKELKEFKCIWRICGK